MNTITARSAKETLEVIYNSDIEIYLKISQKLINLLEKIASECQEKIMLKENTELVNQPISDEAKAILTLIYKDYIANSKEQKELNNTYFEKQNKIEETLKYNPNDIFKTKKVETNVAKIEVNEELLPINIQDKWYKKILKFFKNLFHK